MPGKWNTNTSGSWRMDVNIAVGDEEDEYDDTVESDTESDFSDEDN